MEKLIMNSLPELFKQLQAERQRSIEKTGLLTEKLEEHRRKTADVSSEITRLEGEIAEVVASGGDPSAQLRKLRSMRDSFRDLQNVSFLAEKAVDSNQAEVKRITSAMATVFQKSLIETRNRISESLQAELVVLESQIAAWREAVFTVTGELDLETPNSGTEIVLEGLR